MVSAEDLCMGCMKPRTGGTNCPACGWREEPSYENEQLPSRTMIAGKYVLGRTLGQGGFGITYLAWDPSLNVKRAIKEYFPQQISRRSGQTVYPRAGATDLYQRGREKFLQEARTLASLDHPGIVEIIECVEENNTAYMVMKYLEGETLLSEIQREGRLPFERGRLILMFVMDALREAHRNELLHRDVSPDNIYVCSSGQVKLLDFGAARSYVAERSQDLTMILKHGYAPFEQYQSQGQGPWTDVYASAATLYHTITGQVPPSAPDRSEKDTIKKPGSLGVKIPPASEAALMKGLAVRAKDRFQEVVLFQRAIGLAGPPPPPPRAPDFSKVVKFLLVVVVLVFAVRLYNRITAPQPKPQTVSSNPPSAFRPVVPPPSPRLSKVPPNTTPPFVPQLGIEPFRTGWAGAMLSFTFFDDAPETAEVKTIQGEVGQQLNVEGPTDACKSKAGQSIAWTGSVRVATGMLPPGLTMSSGSNHTLGNISGSPTVLGDWTVTLELYDAHCDGQSLAGLKQDLHFHIARPSPPLLLPAGAVPFKAKRVIRLYLAPAAESAPEMRQYLDPPAKIPVANLAGKCVWWQVDVDWDIPANLMRIISNSGKRTYTLGADLSRDGGSPVQSQSDFTHDFSHNPDANASGSQCMADGKWAAGKYHLDVRFIDGNQSQTISSGDFEVLPFIPWLLR